LHRPGTAKLGHDLLAHRDLTLGEHERQPIVELLEQPTGACLSRHRSMRSRIGPSIRHGQLQRKRLVEAHPVPTLRDHRPLRRLMHCSEGCLEFHYAG